MPREWPPAQFAEHFRLLPPTEQLSGEDFDRLTKALQSVRPALDEACKLADMPRGRHHIHYERNPIATLLPDQLESRRLASLLVCEAARQSQTGETREALRSCRAALNAVRSLGDEPFIISQLIRSAGVAFSCQAVERTLAQGEPPPEDMASLQKLLEDEDHLASWFLATRGERAALHQVFDAVEQGDVSVDELAQTRSPWLVSTFVSMWRMNTSQDNALFLSLMSRRIAETQLPMYEQVEAEKRFEKEVHELPRSAVITGLLMPAMTKVGEGFRRKHASLRCTIVALAAERYRREKKAWPDTIDQLCPQYLAVVPLDPFDGRPLRYRRVDDGIVIYSVANDTIDNGGHLDREPDSSGRGPRLPSVGHDEAPPAAAPKPPAIPEHR